MTTPQQVLGGRYEVGDLIGRGGMAEVHVGHDTRLGRSVAIKLLRSDLARDPTFINRFRREAQSAAGLNHASIVAIYDHGEDLQVEAGGAEVHVPYIIMEFVSGQTLRDHLGERGHLRPAEAARITEGILDALAYSHRGGIVHRDIKPANVMVTDTGEVKVMDFGIARAIADTNATMTQTQAVIGTAQYLSPEQAQGQTVDARSDLYSTGCLLFELLTGRAPFTGDSPVSIAYQHVGEQPPRASSLDPAISPAMDDIVAHALVKDREGRYQDAEDFRDDLLAFRLGRPISSAAAGSASAAAATQVVPAIGPEPTELYAAQTLPPDGNTATLPAVGRDPDEEPPKRRAGAYVLLVLAVLAVIGLLGWAAKAYLGDRPAAPTKVTVPQLVGLQDTAAKALLDDLHLRMQANPVADNAPKGQVIEQSEPRGTLVPQDTIINVEVSTGPDEMVIPDVANSSVDEARNTLQQADFVVAAEVETVNDSQYAKGKVDSTTPAAGQSVKKGSTITLKVSSGKVTVPQVVGKKQAEAYAALGAAGLNVATPKQVESDEPAGTILKQDPAGGLADRNSDVQLWVAIPKVETPTTPPTTPTDTPTTPTSTTTTSTPPTTTTTGGG